MFLTSQSQHEATYRDGDKKASLRLAIIPSQRLKSLGAIMTSISATSNNSYPSPLQNLQAELQKEVSSGTASSSDQDALSAALSNIDSSLQTSGGGASAGGTNSSPGGLKSKIDDLIAGQVSSGKLTSAQASELQGVFKAAFTDGAGGPGGAGGAHHGHHGHAGAAPADGSSSTDSTGNTSSANDALQQFLQLLQNSSSGSSSATYSPTGVSDPANSSNTSFSALLIDYQT
jgi:hypothetical protein